MFPLACPLFPSCEGQFSGSNSPLPLLQGHLPRLRKGERPLLNVKTKWGEKKKKKCGRGGWWGALCEEKEWKRQIKRWECGGGEDGEASVQGAGERSRCRRSGMRPKWEWGKGVPEECARRGDSLEDRRKIMRVGAREDRILVGSRHRHTSNPPMPVRLAQPQGREGKARGGPSPLPLRSSPPPKAGRGSQGGGRDRRSIPTSKLGAQWCPARCVGRNDRGMGTTGWGGGKKGASGGSSLFKVCGRQRSRLRPPPAASPRFRSARTPQPRPLPRRVLRPLPSRAREPLDPLQPSQCPSAPAPSLRAGSPARRERKVNGQPQPQRQITMRKINQEIAVRVPGSRRRTPLGGRGEARGSRAAVSGAWRGRV